jgi:hypothetical protein
MPSSESFSTSADDIQNPRWVAKIAGALSQPSRTFYVTERAFYPPLLPNSLAKGLRAEGGVEGVGIRLIGGARLRRCASS